MAKPIPTRFSDAELAMIDRLVGAGCGDSRSGVIRAAVHELAASEARRQVGKAIADSYREVGQSQHDDELALTNACALTEAEPW